MELKLTIQPKLQRVQLPFTSHTRLHVVSITNMSNFINLHLPREVSLLRNDAASSQFQGNYEHHLADT